MTPAARAMRRTHSAEELTQQTGLFTAEINKFAHSVNGVTVIKFSASGPAPRFWTFVFAHEMCSLSPNLDDSSYIDWSADAKSSCRSAKSTVGLSSAWSRSANRALPDWNPTSVTHVPITKSTAAQKRQARGHNLGVHHHESRTKLLSESIATRADVPLLCPQSTLILLMESPSLSEPAREQHAVNWIKRLTYERPNSAQ